MSRLFFALWPDDETRLQIVSVADEFRNENVRLVKSANLHMTLIFLGEVSDFVKKDVLEQAASIKSRPFNMNFNRVGWWEKPRIVWLGPSEVTPAISELLEALYKILKKHGIKPEKRRFKPHVTIARKAKQFSAVDSGYEILWRVKQFALVNSTSTESGVEYRVLKSWPLTKFEGYK